MLVVQVELSVSARRPQTQHHLLQSQNASPPGVYRVYRVCLRDYCGYAIAVAAGGQQALAWVAVRGEKQKRGAGMGPAGMEAGAATRAATSRRSGGQRLQIMVAIVVRVYSHESRSAVHVLQTYI